jgi:hypothetical protein
LDDSEGIEEFLAGHFDGVNGVIEECEKSASKNSFD